MTTIGDMLRMDESGRFTTSGKGASVTEALESAALPQQVHSDDPEQATREPETFAVVDREGRLCGYYDSVQANGVLTISKRKGSTLVLESRPTTEQRLGLLRRSFENPLLTPHQSAEVAKEIDEILSARTGQAKQHSSIGQQADATHAKDNERLIVRDKNGAYLGMHTLAEARRRWPKSIHHDALINTNETVPFGQAANSAMRNLPAVTGYSSKVNSSLSAAKEFVRSFKKRKASRYWKARDAFTYKVLHHSNDPVCEVPYSCLEACFDDAWIVISRSEVQLVTTWTSDQILKRSQHAIQLAKEKYHEVGAAGTKCLTKLQFAERSRDSKPVGVRSASAANSSKDERRTWITRYVTRDLHGLFLGVYSTDEARSFWPEAYVSSYVILVPEVVTLADAAAAISHTAGFNTSFSNLHLNNAIRRASKLFEKLAKEGQRLSWNELAGKRFVVRNNPKTVIARLKPSEIKSIIGNDWFLVSRDEVYALIKAGDNFTSNRLINLERRLYPKKVIEDRSVSPGIDEEESRRKARQAAFEARQAEREAKRNARENREAERLVPEAPRRKALQPAKEARTVDMFYVYAPNNKTLYQCILKRAKAVRSYLERVIPNNSLEITPRGMRLKQEPTQLGFANTAEFTHACAVASKGGNPETIAKEQASRSSARQLDAYTGGQVSFDGPERTLFIFKGTLACNRKGHKLEGATGIIATLKGTPALINVNYCHNCNKFFLGQGEYEHYRMMYGPVLGNFSFYKNESSGGRGYDDLSPRSILNLCGYNVNQAEDLSSKERQLVLASVMDRGICSKPKVISHLEWLIRSHKNNPNMWIACDKWEEDLNWVRSYRIDKQRRFVVKDVRRNR